MENYQYCRVDDDPDWTIGRPRFDPIWRNTSDMLRFHTGQGFRIKEQGDDGPIRSLAEVGHYLPARIENAPLDRVFTVTSEKDHTAIKYRRHRVSEAKADIMMDRARQLKNTPYIFGLTDCSWFVDDLLDHVDVHLTPVHNSHAMMESNQVHTITKDQIKPMDLLEIHAPDHIAVFWDWEFGGRVADTEPSDAPAPWGGMQGRGVQIRSMAPGYYCSWANVNRIGRVYEVNGHP